METQVKLCAGRLLHFLLGFIGPKAEAEEIREKIKQFLGTMNLTLSTEKTLITHATTQKARFLGYEIQTAQEDAKWSKKTAKIRKRSINGQIILKVPDEVERDWQKKYSKAGKPNARARLIECSDYEIIQTYGIELRGLVNYYQLATNVSKKLYPVKYWMEQSLVKTLAAKHKQKVTWVYRTYKVKSEQGLGAIRVVVPNSNNPEKPLIAQFAGISIETRPYASITDDIKTRYHGRNELVGRLLANECELCGSDQDIRVHHLHQLKDLKKKYAGRTEPPPWATFMIERNRKTIVVCQECHRKIHKGKYDGKRVT
ncbi:MAG: hypothetical protein HYR94_10805 [Chloroflexi bacterium]|nr:hypothetical protein [Chloroflexota bacterium]